MISKLNFNFWLLRMIEEYVVISGYWEVDSLWVIDIFGVDMDVNMLISDNKFFFSISMWWLL